MLVGTGVDGFKNDGTDPFILELDVQGGAKGHDGNTVCHLEDISLCERARVCVFVYVLSWT